MGGCLPGANQAFCDADHNSPALFWNSPSPPGAADPAIETGRAVFRANWPSHHDLRDPGTLLDFAVGRP
jgi:hypothetical protein